MKTRARWRIGEISAAKVMDEMSVEYRRGKANRYFPEQSVVELTGDARFQRDIHAIFAAVHECMHARQHRDRLAGWKWRIAAGRMKWLWLAGAALVALGAATGAVAMLVAGGCCVAVSVAVRVYGIIAMEGEAWRMAKAWMENNFVTGPHEWRAMDEMEAAGLRGYWRIVLRP